jgi:hypothetical protein
MPSQGWAAGLAFVGRPMKLRCWKSGWVNTMCEACAKSLAEWAKRDSRDARHYRGVHVVKKPLSNGSMAAYFYAWRGGRQFAGHGTGVQFPTRKFEVQFQNARASKPKDSTSKPLSVQNLIVNYKTKPGPRSQKKSYMDLKPSTRRTYDVCLCRIGDKWGTLPVGLITEKTVAKLRGRIADWMVDLEKKHGEAAATYTIKVMGIVFAHAIFHGDLVKGAHPTIDIPLTYDGGHRPEKLWDEDREIAFYKAAPDYLGRGLFMGNWTGQRQDDCARMTFGRQAPDNTGKVPPYYDPKTKWLFLCQEKTQALVGFPAPYLFAEKLDEEWERRQRLGISETRILLSSRGKPWASTHSFASKFNKVKNTLLGGTFRDLHYHDSRGTAATRLALAGVPLHQVASITGHKESSIRTLVERYLGGRIELAEKAMATAHADPVYVARMKKVGEAFSWAA